MLAIEFAKSINNLRIENAPGSNLLLDHVEPGAFDVHRRKPPRQYDPFDPYNEVYLAPTEEIMKMTQKELRKHLNQWWRAWQRKEKRYKKWKKRMDRIDKRIEKHRQEMKEKAKQQKQSVHEINLKKN